MYSEYKSRASNSSDDFVIAGMGTNAFKYDPENNFPEWTEQESMVRNHLTLDMYKKLYKLVTPLGVTLDRCIQGSCEQVKDEVIIGMVAGDEYCFDTFKDIFDPVINEYHMGFGPSDKQPAPDLDADKLKIDGVLDEKYVKSCRVRTARNLSGVPLPPCICRAERKVVERVFTGALNSLDGDLKGQYYPLKGMNKEDAQRLRDDHFLFQKPTGHILVNSSAVRDWPTGRGIWHNESKNFLAWINEEDHCRIMAMEKGGDMKAVFSRFTRGLKQVEQQMKQDGHKFQWSERLGYLSACPSNIGTGLRCSVHIQLRHMGTHPDIKDICKKLHVEKRGTSGEETAAIDDIYDISNEARVSRTEVQFVQIVIDGTKKLIEMEKRMEEGKSIDDLIPAEAQKPQ